MTVYEKLASARLRFLDAGVQPTGKNVFAKYVYYNLDDILPAINRIAGELKFLCVTNFTAETAVLRVIDAENPDSFIEFSCPMSRADLKGCHEVQQLGAAITYIKRYLYQNAFEISEPDVCNATAPAGNKPKQDKPLTVEDGLRSKRQEVINEIGKVMTAGSSAGLAYFTDAEKADVKDFIGNTGHHQVGLDLLAQKKAELLSELAKREKTARNENSAGGAEIF